MIIMPISVNGIYENLMHKKWKPSALLFEIQYIVSEVHGNTYMATTAELGFWNKHVDRTIGVQFGDSESNLN